MKCHKTAAIFAKMDIHTSRHGIRRGLTGLSIKLTQYPRPRGIMTKIDFMAFRRGQPLTWPGV